jgi:YegS/Rv2252/BmrU family lipid kinase
MQFIVQKINKYAHNNHGNANENNILARILIHKESTKPYYCKQANNMQHRILYIINPISGRKNKQALHKVIEATTKKAGFYFEIFPSVSTGDYSFLDELIETKSFTTIVIAGGDGTVNQAINSLKKHKLPFAIIPCGSGNGLAFSAGIPKNNQTALDIAFTGKSEWTDAFTINDQFACMLCGLGFDAQVAHDFALDKKRGLITYVKKIITNFFTAKPYPFVLKLNDKTIKSDAYFISIANSNQFGNNFTIAPKASLTDGLLDIVMVTQQTKLNLILQTLVQVSGFNQLQKAETINKDTSVVYFQTNAIQITNSSLAPLHIDGEPVESLKKIDIKIQPKSFQLIYPK